MKIKKKVVMSGVGITSILFGIYNSISGLKRGDINYVSLIAPMT